MEKRGEPSFSEAAAEAQIEIAVPIETDSTVSLPVSPHACLSPSCLCYLYYLLPLQYGSIGEFNLRPVIFPLPLRWPMPALNLLSRKLQGKKVSCLSVSVVEQILTNYNLSEKWNADGARRNGLRSGPATVPTPASASSLPTPIPAPALVVPPIPAPALVVPPIPAPASTPNMSPMRPATKRPVCLLFSFGTIFQHCQSRFLRMNKSLTCRCRALHSMLKLKSSRLLGLSKNKQN